MKFRKTIDDIISRIKIKDSMVFKEIKIRLPNQELRLLKEGKFKFNYPTLGYGFVDPARSECKFSIASIDDKQVYGLCFEIFIIPEYEKRGYGSICKECKAKIPYKHNKHYGKPVIMDVDKTKPGDLELIRILNDPTRAREKFNLDLNKIEGYAQELNTNFLRSSGRREILQETIRQVEYILKDNVRAEKGF